MGKGGLEPPRPFGHMILNHARLPIPTLPRVAMLEKGCQTLKVNQFYD